MGTHHFHQGEVEEDAGGNGEDPVLHRRVRGDEEAHVEPQEGCEGAEEVHHHGDLDREAGAEQDGEVTWGAGWVSAVSGI